MIQRLMDLIGDADIVFCGNDHSETPGQVEGVDDAKIEYWNQQQQMLELSLIPLQTPFHKPWQGTQAIQNFLIDKCACQA